MTYLHHITLTTGDIRRSPREEVSDEAIAVCAGLLRDALSGGEPLLPVISPPLTVTATDGGRCMTATLWAADERAPVYTIGVAGRSRCGAKLWRLLHDHAVGKLATTGKPCPPEPWCASRIDPGIAVYGADPDAWAAIADFSRCLAWAWLDRAHADA